MQVKFQHKRLLKLAEVLRQVPRKRFNINEWASAQFCGKNGEPQHNECGATACAFGWACSIPAFRKVGLTMKMKETVWSYPPGKLPTPSFQGRYGFDAASLFFGINRDEIEDLFSADNPNSAKLAARRIKKLVVKRLKAKNLTTEL